MNGTLYMPISASALSTAAALARQCSMSTVRERVLVSHVVALAVSPTATSIFDLSTATRYAPPAYPAYHQEAPYATSVSDRRRRLCYSHV